MAGYVGRTERGNLVLTDLEDLKNYCYFVAGIVGEMLTELFLLGRPTLSGVAAFLRGRAAAFGEALQLVNILKDAAGDAAEGRTLPAARRFPRRGLRPRAAGSRHCRRLHRRPAGGRSPARPRRVHRPAGHARPSFARPDRKARPGLESQPAGSLSPDPEVEAGSRPRRAGGAGRPLSGPITPRGPAGWSRTRRATPPASSVRDLER